MPLPLYFLSRSGRKYPVVKKIVMVAANYSSIYVVHDGKGTRHIAKVWKREYWEYPYATELLAMTLKHPSLIGAFCLGSMSDGASAVLMEKMVCDLWTACFERDDEFIPGLSDEGLLRIYYETLCGLHQLHVAGILYMDVKLDNMGLFRRDGRWGVKLFDWSLATLHVGSSRIKRVSKDLEPPENRGSKSLTRYDRRTDLWTVGVCLAVLTCRRDDFRKRDGKALSETHLYDERDRVERHLLGSRVGSVLVPLIRRDPRERKDALELLRRPVFDEVRSAPFEKFFSPRWLPYEPLSSSLCPYQKTEVRRMAAFFLDNLPRGLLGNLSRERLALLASYLCYDMYFNESDSVVRKPREKRLFAEFLRGVFAGPLAGEINFFS